MSLVSCLLALLLFLMLHWFLMPCCLSRPSISFLAGRNSVYHGIPKEVLAAAFNVDRQTLEELGRDQEIIFPPYNARKEESRTRSHSRRGEHERYEERYPYSQEEERYRRGEHERYEERHSRYPQSPSEDQMHYWWEQALSYVM